MKRPTRLSSNQQGFASIAVALTLIIVLALLTVGFSQLARREQQNALRRQLAVQANYAAESGINDTSQMITQYLASHSPAELNASTLNSPDTCLSVLPSPLPPLDNQIGTNSGVSYTCILVNTRPPNIIYTDIAPGSSQYMQFSTTPAANTITIDWKSSDGKTAFRNNTNFEKLNNWNSPGVLQFSLTPLANPNNFSRAELINNTITLYLYPSQSGQVTVDANTAKPGGANFGAIRGSCVNGGDYQCRVTITGLNNTDYVMHFIDYYDTSDIRIDGTTNSGGDVDFTGQVLIDATGKARDVLKRLQVRLPLLPQPVLPAYSAEAQSLCKRIQTYPGQTGTHYIDTNGTELPLSVSGGRETEVFNPCNLEYVVPADTR